MRRFGLIAGMGIAALLARAPPAFAQDYGELPAWLVEARLTAIIGAGVAGFLLGLLFSPLV